MNTGGKLASLSGLHGVSAAMHLLALSNLQGTTSSLLLSLSKTRNKSALELLILASATNAVIIQHPVQYPLAGLTETMFLAGLRQLLPLTSFVQSLPIVGSFQLFILSGKTQLATLANAVQKYPMEGQFTPYVLNNKNQSYALAGKQQSYLNK